MAPAAQVVHRAGRPLCGAAAASVGRPFVDVLIVDDMENVHNKFPLGRPGPRVDLNGVASAQAALQQHQLNE